MNPSAEMVGQFLLGQEEVAAVASWRKKQLGRWILHWHPRLQVSDIRGHNGVHIGWLMGLAIDASGEPVGPVWRPSMNGDEADAPAQFESALNSLAGRFAAVFLSPASERFYLDASGSLAAVYSKDHPVVASSCNLIPQSDGLGPDPALVQAFGIPRRVGYFPFGLTPWLRISRLMASHYLDLRQWTAKRHWPTGERFASTQNPEQTIHAVASLLEQFISGVAKLAPIQLTLTGGHDSRALLACSRPSLSSIRFITTRLPDLPARVDCAYGRLIAKRFGLDYSVLTWRKASAAEIEAWIYRTGMCVMDRIATSIRTDEQLDPKRVTLLGIGGEVGQGYYWRPEEFLAHPLTADRLIERFGFPRLDLVGQAASEWIAGTPNSDLVEKLDLFFLEQRLGCWAGPAMYGTIQARFVTYPHNSRSLYEKMLSMPNDYRRQARLPIDMIRLKWPELLDLPFNQPFGLLGLEYKAKRSLQNIRTKLGNAGARKIKSTLVRVFGPGADK